MVGMLFFFSRGRHAFSLILFYLLDFCFQHLPSMCKLMQLFVQD
uniref:Uncharacterized protein n=1 Tax=Arundo donax TaxID=35708 RepID=A0A0A9GQQ2_ARUDO